MEAPPALTQPKDYLESLLAFKSNVNTLLTKHVEGASSESADAETNQIIAVDDAGSQNEDVIDANEEVARIKRPRSS
jgi:hypothetical protein